MKVSVLNITVDDNGFTFTARVDHEGECLLVTALHDRLQQLFAGMVSPKVIIQHTHIGGATQDLPIGFLGENP